MQHASVAEGSQQEGLHTADKLQQWHDQQEQLPVERKRKPGAAVDKESKRGKAAFQNAASLGKASKKQPSKRKKQKVDIEKLSGSEISGGAAGLAAAREKAK